MQALALELLYLAVAMKGFHFKFGCLAVFLWVLLLEYLAVAADRPQIDEGRLKFWKEIQDVNLSAFLPYPEIHLVPKYMKASDLPSELRSDKDFEKIASVFKFLENDEADKAYLKADDFITHSKNANLNEWVYFLKADCLFKVQDKKNELDRKYNLVLEEYQDAVRRFPLNPAISRIVYQIGLTQLKMGFYDDVQSTVDRGLRDYNATDLAADYHLLIAESEFLAKDDVKATQEYSFIIQKFPTTDAAVDAAFRKAVILFRKGDYKLAMKVYEELDKYHSDETQKLKMEVEPELADKYVDRAFYAETVYLNGRDVEAAKLFQDLANLFPKNPVTAFLLFRLGDTYRRRGEIRAAESIYADVVKNFSKEPIVKALGNIRLADLYFLTDDLRAGKMNEKLYDQAFEISRQIGNDPVAAIALVKLSAYYLAFKILPKAQSVLKQYRDTFKDPLPNTEWVNQHYFRTVEVEILDNYNREDYLAALTTYLVYEKNQATGNFTDTRVLLKLADAAEKLSLQDKAAQILNRVIYLEKSSAGRQEALLKLVQIYIAEGDLRKASERLRRFNFAYPATPLKNLYEMYWGHLYTKLKNNDQAATHYELAIAAANKSGIPKNVYEVRQSYLQLGELYQAMSLSPKAIDAYLKYIKLISNYNSSPLSEFKITLRDKFNVKVSRYRIADLYFDMQDYVRALDAYKTVIKEIKEEPFYSHARYRIGECYLALNDRTAALAAFKDMQATGTATAATNNLWVKAAATYIQGVNMEVKYGIRIFN